ncbi:MAG: MBL fold metallo-hydrolase, partial [Clostridia bacterium]|nr:MBL fold metallo-hydrolase [Clostridia bacterium]
IETNGRKILFDMGQTEAYADNAEKLGIDLAQVDLAVLSHGHYDHGGGLKRFLALNDHAPVYVSRHAFGEYFNGTEKYIGLDKTLMENPRLIFTQEKLVIADGLTLFSCNDRPRPNSLGCFGLTERKNGECQDDPFLHEQYLLIEEDGKRVLISGCSHKGILDITEWFHPDVLIGGFHLSKCPLDDRLEQIALQLDSHPTNFYTCHCTGEEQYHFLAHRMKRLSYLSCGQTVVL